MTFKIRPRMQLIIALFCATLATGCSDQMAAVTGTVTLDGKPIELGALVFHALGKAKLTATIQSDGTYELSQGGRSEVEPGSYTVTVVGYKRDENQKPGMPPNHQVNTPPRYSSKETSELKAEVKTGSNTFDFSLNSSDN